MRGTTLDLPRLALRARPEPPNRSRMLALLFTQFASLRSLVCCARGTTAAAAGASGGGRAGFIDAADARGDAGEGHTGGHYCYTGTAAAAAD